MKSAAGDDRTPAAQDTATNAETPSDSATETETDLRENEMGLFKV
jgi:hypothetical protein